MSLATAPRAARLGLSRRSVSADARARLPLATPLHPHGMHAADTSSKTCIGVDKHRVPKSGLPECPKSRPGHPGSAVLTGRELAPRARRPARLARGPGCQACRSASRLEQVRHVGKPARLLPARSAAINDGRPPVSRPPVLLWADPHEGRPYDTCRTWAAPRLLGRRPAHGSRSPSGYFIFVLFVFCLGRATVTAAAISTYLEASRRSRKTTGSTPKSMC